MSEQSKAQSTESLPGGRGPDGRFLPGNKGGPGNPYARQSAALRHVVMARCTEDRMAKVADAMLDRAEKGSENAAKLLFQYTLGKPQEMPAPDHLDFDELETHKEGNIILQRMMDAGKTPHQDLVLDIIRGMHAHFAEEMRDTLSEGIAKLDEAEATKSAAERQSPLPNGFSKDDWLSMAQRATDKVDATQTTEPSSDRNGRQG